jgi:histidine triad (HIT) family protein
MHMDCIFCRIAAGTLPATIVHEDEHTVAFRDVNPEAPTHVLIIPREHVSSVSDLSDTSGCDAGRLLLAARDIAKALGIDSYRLVANTGPAAGQTVDHLHIHLLAGRSMAWPPG